LLGILIAILRSDGLQEKDDFQLGKKIQNESVELLRFFPLRHEKSTSPQSNCGEVSNRRSISSQ
jgi:hypothetical protein